MVRFVTAAAAVTMISAAAHAAGDAAKGEAVFQQQCGLCHNANKGGGNGLGPNLFAVVGRKAASLPAFYYSPALKKSNIVWSEATLKKWVAGPQNLVPGTRMSFAGVKNQQDIDHIVAFLASRK